MPATDVKFGISKHAGALIESVETTEKIEKKELKGSNGAVARVHVYNPTTEGSVKGHGALTLVPGIGASGVSTISGGVTVINEVKRTESHDDFDGWEYNFTNYGTAQDVT